MERINLDICKYCSSDNIHKCGFSTNKYNEIQRYECLECKKYFTSNFRFENTRVDSSMITAAM